MDQSRSDYQFDWRTSSNHHAQSTPFQDDRTPGIRPILTFPTDRWYKCGFCSSIFHVIWQLHEHMLLHATSGSYHYYNNIRTAFPKYDSVSQETQTDSMKDFETNKTVDLVCNATQTEESLCNFFLGRGDCSEYTEENSGGTYEVDIEVKVEKSDNEVSEVVDNADKEYEVVNDSIDDKSDNLEEAEDMYNGDTDEDIKYLSFDESDNVIKDSVWSNVEEKKSKRSKSDKTSKLSKKKKDKREKKSSKKENSSRKEKNSRKDKSAKKKLKMENTKASPIKIKTKEVNDDNAAAAVNKPLIQCKYCDKSFPNNLHMRRHCIQDHPEEKNFQCRYCDKAFVTEAEVQRHRREHNKEKNKCNICNKVLSSAQNLQDHITVHTGEKMFGCKDCGNFFRSRSQLSLHISRRHNPNYDHMCENCGRVFKCRQNLQCHIKCCLDIRPFGCQICGKRYPRNTNLNVHMRKHTGEKPFVCHTCGMKFSHSNTLTKHMLVHTGERKFKCEVCGQKFKAHNALKDHERIHKQEKRFTCQYCGKGFIKKCNMVTHIRQHTGETPYKCNICGQAYKQNVLLRTHMQTHKNEIPPPVSRTSQQSADYIPTTIVASIPVLPTVPPTGQSTQLTSTYTGLMPPQIPVTHSVSHISSVDTSENHDINQSSNISMHSQSIQQYNNQVYNVSGIH